ncbi:hypothetical protein E4631_17540 [Hymenobacter sp. UV11]|uniref:hypothetical protein n=1 Tax=Hymenobacter sp. UV11 TaxID=1849735 RepID=UPI00105C5BD8|nr:hypothetical protein [Hymenobacter sp. UV11]TFZ64796.1 hypothetical protein E4631_17540 [Hymenobacter sp. UV11]
MFFSQAKDNLSTSKGIALLSTLFGLNAISRLLWPSSAVAGPSKGLPDYSIIGIELLVSLAGLFLFRWLHRRVRRVATSEVGLQMLDGPAKSVAWSDVSSVQKKLSNLLSGFYLISLSDGSDFYTPVEREPPSFSALGQWLSDAPTMLEQLSRKHGVWVD